jgi:hypothetical protein
MSRVKLWVGILLVMVLALGPAAVQASTITYWGQHTFNTTVERVGLGTFLSPTSGTLTAGISGGADYNPSEGYNTKTGPTAIVPGSSSTVGLNLPPGAWLKNNMVITGYDGATGGVISLYRIRFSGHKFFLSRQGRVLS